MARPRVVIVGAGFGGMHAARALAACAVEVIVIDRTNHHVFQPLLYQVATAALAPTDITAPIRWVLRHQRNASVILDEVAGIDASAKTVKLASGNSVTYDWLILATGARHAYFGHDEWEQFAPGLKSIDDALNMRTRFLYALERAEESTSDDERRAWQTIIVVGGGPTGVELAGVLPEITRKGLRDDFRHIDSAETRIILVEAGPRLLPAFPEDLATHAQKDLEELGVEVRLNTRVTNITVAGAQLDDEFVAANTVFWAAGNAASPLGRMLGVPVDRAGRVKVENDLRAPGHPEIFVIGDLADLVQDGAPVPAVAPAAMQMGGWAGKCIKRAIAGQSTRPFRYRNKGNLATIGRHKAIAEIGRVHLSGALAWWFWLFLHILYLVGFRNRVSVLVEWGYLYFTYQRGARLITVSTARKVEALHPPSAPAELPPKATPRSRS